jgi:hypothetical protein
MQLINETNDAAVLLRSERSPDVMLASLLVRRRMRLLANGGPLQGLGPLGEHEAKAEIRHDRVDLGEFGSLEPDLIFPRRGTDLIILAYAQPKSPGAVSTTVRIKTAHYHLNLKVFGDRVWTRSAQDVPVPSPPGPLGRVPLAYSRAFGGCARTEYGELPYADNPVGKGYQLHLEHVLDTPLPNVERLESPIVAWNDRPEPVACAPYPMQWGLRMGSIVGFDALRQQLTVHPEKGLFDRAHPRLSGHPIRPGEVVELDGLLPPSQPGFVIPDCPYALEVRRDAACDQLMPELEEVLVDLRTEQAVVDLSYRATFRYPFKPMQVRKAVLKNIN